MNFTVDLLWVSEGIPAPVWPIGKVRLAQPFVASLARVLGERASSSNTDAVLFWDASLGTPNQAFIQELAVSPVDCWHAGLKLGMGGSPGVLDFMSPTWMLACDPPANIDATSWRLSLRACLVKMDVLRKLGGPCPEFQTLEVAALEMGHRWVRRGALMRHVPELLDHRTTGLPTQRSVVTGPVVPK